MNRLFNSLLYLALSCSATATFAADSDNNVATFKTLSNSPVSGSALLQTFGGLLLVLAIIAFLAWLLRRTGQFNSAANGEMKIIASLSLGSREKAVLLQVGEQQILVGVTAQQVQTLHVLEHAINTKTNPDSSLPSFADKLQQMMKQRSGQQS